ncbi:hypothetical protein B5J92_01580 [Moraxella atlantae]|nr:hypothetical protein B5J92_01580 [Moraxella atlantae]
MRLSNATQSIIDLKNNNLTYLEIKQGWLRPCDYFDFDSLRYGVNRLFANIGLLLNLNFKLFVYIVI